MKLTVLTAALLLSAAAPAWAQNDPPGGAASGLIRAQITARQSTQISSEMAGRIRELNVRDGDRFKEGQTLARFNCAAQDSQLARARAVHEKKRRILEADAKLRSLGSVSAVEHDVAAAEVAEAAADINVMRALLDRCTIVAPFGGRVAAVPVRQHQFVSEGQPLLEILDDRDLEVEMMVPSRWLGWLKPGYDFSVEVAETGRSYPARITRLSGRVDPVNQSIKVYGRITGQADDPLLPGMSGRTVITPPSQPPS